MQSVSGSVFPGASTADRSSVADGSSTADGSSEAQQAGYNFRPDREHQTPAAALPNYRRWHIQEEHLLLNNCKLLSPFERRSIQAATEALMKRNLAPIGRVGQSISKRLHRYGLLPDFTNTHLDYLLKLPTPVPRIEILPTAGITASASVMAPSVIPLLPIQPSLTEFQNKPEIDQQQPAPINFQTAASSHVPDYMDVQKVFRFESLSENVREHIRSLWRDIPPDIKDIDKRIDRLCRRGHYSKHTLVSLRRAKKPY